MKRLLLAVLLAAASAWSHADVIFDNGLGIDDARSGYFSTGLQERRLLDDFALTGTRSIERVFFQMGLTDDPFAGSFSFTIYQNPGNNEIGAAIYQLTLGPGDYTAIPNAISSYPYTTFYDVSFQVGALTLDAGNYLLSFYGQDLEFRSANTGDDNGSFLQFDQASGDISAISGGLPFRLDGATPSASIPEPSSLLLAGIALAALALQRRRQSST